MLRISHCKSYNKIENVKGPINQQFLKMFVANETLKSTEMIFLFAFHLKFSLVQHL